MELIHLPDGAKYILDKLSGCGYEAYVVGGCVRDSLLGLRPNDWDICTSASPDEVCQHFSDQRVVKTGLRHGTVSIVLQDGTYEVTTFRIDGEYSDHRHPDEVVFTKNLLEDLSRRDFTINAMAYGPSGLIDFFGGQEDLKHGIISCVGNPDARFQEDALRILRALRFASTYGFSIKEETAQSIHKNRGKLSYIAAERIRVELCKLLRGEGAFEILTEFSDVISVIIPEIRPCIGFEQNNRFHQYTVYHHIARAVANYKGDDDVVNISLLLHDIGKPQCYTEDERGGHFYGHGVPGHDISEKVLSRLRFDNKSKNSIVELVLYHDSVIEPTEKTVRRWLNKIGREQFSRLLDIRIADILAHAEGTQQSRIERYEALKGVFFDVLQKEQCFQLRDMKISGDDILSLGVPEGKKVGETLSHLLEGVIAGEISNDEEALHAAAMEYLKRGNI